MIAAVENAMAARILAASQAGTLGYALRTVAVYAGDFDDGLAAVVRQFPGVWIAMRSLGRGEKTAGGWKIPATFSVFAGTTNRRNQKASRHGAAGDVGSLQIVKDVRRLLVDRTLGLEIDRIAPGPVTGLINAKVEGAGASVYACEFITAWIEPFEGDVPDADLDDFATFHADWDIPPIGNIEPPLPAATPDASDTVILETA